MFFAVNANCKLCHSFFLNRNHATALPTLNCHWTILVDIEMHSDSVSAWFKQLGSWLVAPILRSSQPTSKNKWAPWGQPRGNVAGIFGSICALKTTTCCAVLVNQSGLLHDFPAPVRKKSRVIKSCLRKIRYRNPKAFCVEEVSWLTPWMPKIFLFSVWATRKLKTICWSLGARNLVKIFWGWGTCVQLTALNKGWLDSW